MAAAADPSPLIHTLRNPKDGGGYVFEASASSFWGRPVRVYLRAGREDLWGLYEPVARWQAAIQRKELRVNQLLAELRRLDQNGLYSFRYTREDTLLPYRRTYQVDGHSA